MTDVINAVIINGYVGKELTLSFLNKMLILKGFKVLYLRFDKDGFVKDVFINNELIKHTTLKSDEIIFDEIDIVCDLYREHKCDVLITRSSAYNTCFNPIIYGVSRYNTEKILGIQNNSFLSKNIPTVCAMQVSEVMSIIHTICETVKSPLFISEHHHYSYIKHNTGLNIDYSYLSFVLALNISEIVDDILNGREGTFNKVKMYGYPMLKYTLPKIIPKNIEVTAPYYIHTQTKYNVDFLFDVGKTCNAMNDVLSLYNKDVDKDVIKICIFGPSMNNELLDIVETICHTKFETVYIADYDEMGYSYEDLTYLKKNGTMPTSLTQWSETMYKAFANIMHQNIIVDNTKSIVDWNMKYAGLHDDKKFRVLCIGNKRMIDDIKIELNKY